MQPLSVRLPEQYLVWLKSHAEKQETSMVAILKKLMDAHWTVGVPQKVLTVNPQPTPTLVGDIWLRDERFTGLVRVNLPESLSEVAVVELQINNATFSETSEKILSLLNG